MIDRVPSNVTNKSFPCKFYIFDDNEAVLRVIDLDWQFERMTRDSSISISSVRATRQLVDVLAKGAFKNLSVEVIDATFRHPTQRSWRKGWEVRGAVEEGREDMQLFCQSDPHAASSVSFVE